MRRLLGMLRNSRSVAVGPFLGVLVCITSLVAFVLPGKHDSGRLPDVVAGGARAIIAKRGSGGAALLPTADHPRVDLIDGRRVRWWVHRDGRGVWTLTAVVHGTATTRTL